MYTKADPDCRLGEDGSKSVTVILGGHRINWSAPMLKNQLVETLEMTRVA